VKHDSGAYKAVIYEDIWQLFIDGQMMTNARWPNALWSDKTVFNSSYWAKSSDKSTRGIMVDNGLKNLAGSGLNATGAMAVLNIGSFNTFTSIVQSHKPGTPNFTYHDKFGPIKFKPTMNQYFLEDKLEFLDKPEEWFYDKATRTVYVMTPDGQSPEGRDVRGKVMTYTFNITNCRHVIFKKLTFFGTTLWASTLDNNNNFINNLTVHSLNFSYPSYTRRMLQETAPAQWTKVNANKNKKGINTLTFFNNTFFGTDGAVLEFSGLNVTLANNLFEFNDWTAANMVYQSGGIGTIISNGIGDVYVRNTLRFNGASSGIRPGLLPKVRLNHLHHQCWGLIQNDGSHVQTTTGPQTHALLEQNWVHSSPKYGLRFDGQPPKIGYNGIMRSNVVWKCGGMMVKGDNHTVIHNLVFEKRNEKQGDHQGNKCALCVLKYVRENPVPINNNSVVMYNAADVANGGVHSKKLYSLAGGVVKYNVISNVSEQLVDPENFDFRPLSNSTYLQHNAGPYSYDPEMTHYWIPGRQLYKASTPVPPDNSVKVNPSRRDILMWLNGYEASVHLVYFGTNKERVRSATPNSPEYRGSVGNGGNVFHLKINLDPKTEYFWRVDAEVSPSGVYLGDVWSFTTADGDVTLSRGAIAWNSCLIVTLQVTMVTFLILIMQ